MCSGSLDVRVCVMLFASVSHVLGIFRVTPHRLVPRALSPLCGQCNIVSSIRPIINFHSLYRQTTMRAHDRGLVVVVSILLLWTTELCNAFVLGPSLSSSRLPSGTWVKTSPFTAARIIQDDANNRVMQRNHVFTYYNHNNGASSYTSLRQQEGQSNLQSLEQKVEELTEQLKMNGPNSEMLEEEAAKLEIALRQEIVLLKRKLRDADAERRKDKDLQAMMVKERKALEDEIAALRKEYEMGTDWKRKYEEEVEKRGRDEANLKKEIERLQQEVRIVFSIGRRTSDKMVDNLQTMLEEKEEKLSMTLDELNSSKQKLTELEEERQSMRKLWRLSWRLTAQRFRRRLTELRKKILGRALPALDVNKNLEKAKEQAVKVRKSRSR